MRNTGHSTEQSQCDQEEAAILAVGLRLGLVERHEVIAWADQQVLAADEPLLRLIDLADMREAHPLDVYSTLGALSSGTWGTVAEMDAQLLAFCERFEREGAPKPDEPFAHNPPDPQGLASPMIPYPRKLHRCPECAVPVHEADAYCSSCGVEFTPEHKTIMQTQSTAALRREVLVVLAAGTVLALLWWALS